VTGVLLTNAMIWGDGADCVDTEEGRAGEWAHPIRVVAARMRAAPNAALAGMGRMGRLDRGMGMDDLGIGFESGQPGGYILRRVW